MHGSTPSLCLRRKAGSRLLQYGSILLCNIWRLPCRWRAAALKVGGFAEGSILLTCTEPLCSTLHLNAGEERAARSMGAKTHRSVGTTLYGDGC
jgi:hypothetical protein